MDDWITWLGIGIGAGGLVASVAGLFVAYLARRAAKSAEKAAREAAREAREAVVRTLITIEVERASLLISRLQDAHFRRNWDYALGLYPDLRRILSHIAETISPNLAHFRSDINGAVPQITAADGLVRRTRNAGETLTPEDISKLDGVLSKIQQDLESYQGSRIYSDE